MGGSNPRPCAPAQPIELCVHYTGVKLDMRDPMLGFGQPVVVFQPESLCNSGHGRRGEVGVFVGKDSSSSKSLMMYLPARGRNVIRAANYKVIDYFLRIATGSRTQDIRM